MIKQLMAAGANVKASNDGMTAIRRATESGCIDTLRFLLASGADPNAKMPDGTTPLMVAAGQGLTEVVAILLKAGADLDARSQSGQTAWLLAGMSGHMDVVDLFKKHREANPRPPQP
jgi:ankyrin repeat protein